MIPYREALDLILSEAKEQRRIRPLKILEVPTENAVGKICARKVTSKEPVPAFRNSAMDGFAVQSSILAQATQTIPVELKVIGCMAAGNTLPVQNSEETVVNITWEIMTGAAVPDGFDAVVKVEDVKVVTRGNNTFVQFFRPIKSGENIRLPGQDFEVGSELICEGEQIRREHVMACASLGITTLPVWENVSVAVLSTGKEIVSWKTKHIEAGKIRNSTAPYLEKVFQDFGADVLHMGISPDDVGAFLQQLENLSKEYNPRVIVTTGAVSMGKFDFIVPALKEIGAKIFFHKVAIRPGKPILFALLKNGTIFFGLPGNPISSAVGFRFFIAPFLRELLYLSEEQPLMLPLAQSSKKPEGLRCFYKARVFQNNHALHVEALPGQGSFMISSLVKANSWVVFNENGSEVREGEFVEVFSLGPNGISVDLNKFEKIKTECKRGDCC